MEILYEDNHIIIINKKSGEIVQQDKTGDISLDIKLSEFLAQKYNKKGKQFIGVIHRLDRPASGAVIFAKTSKALARLNKMLHDREIKKEYLAIVRKKQIPKKSKLVNYIKRIESKNISLCFDKFVKDSKLAEMEYEIIDEKKIYMLLHINLNTGRHHQIRTQLAHYGIPIVGDNKYGYPRANKDRSICLHAFKVSFTHPVSHTNISVIAPTPNDHLWNLFNNSINTLINHR